MRLPRIPTAIRFGGALALTVLVGCSAGSDNLKKQLKEMDTELTALRADQDRLEERLEAMELSTAVVARDRSARPAAVDERPRLKVIRLAPDEAESSEDGKAPAGESKTQDERPVIRGTGEKVIQSGGSAARDDADPNRPVVAIHGDRVVPETRRGD